jgi:predicted RNA-binding Zn-ribbon protein involved in translation (DUF1610 family)
MMKMSRCLKFFCPKCADAHLLVLHSAVKENKANGQLLFYALLVETNGLCPNIARRLILLSRSIRNRSLSALYCTV